MRNGFAPSISSMVASWRGRGRCRRCVSSAASLPADPLQERGLVDDREPELAAPRRAWSPRRGRPPPASPSCVIAAGDARAGVLGALLRLGAGHASRAPPVNTTISPASGCGPFALRLGDRPHARLEQPLEHLAVARAREEVRAPTPRPRGRCRGSPAGPPRSASSSGVERAEVVGEQPRDGLADVLDAEREQEAVEARPLAGLDRAPSGSRSTSRRSPRAPARSIGRELVDVGEVLAPGPARAAAARSCRRARRCPSRRARRSARCGPRAGPGRRGRSCTGGTRPRARPRAPHTGHFAGMLERASCRAGACSLSTSTTSGITSPARRTRTVSPTRTSLRSTSSWLWSVARLTVTPETSTGWSMRDRRELPGAPDLHHDVEHLRDLDRAAGT